MPTRAAVLAQRIEADLKPAGTATRAKNEKAYLKSALVHFGVPMPVLRKRTLAALREVEGLTHDELVAAVDTLWAKGIHELRAAAIELLTARPRLLTSGDVPLVERLLRESKTWAYVDVLSARVIGALVTADPSLHRTLDRWAKDDDFRIRRSAMLSLLLPLRKGAGAFDRFARYADAMLEEKEFFIRKAIGWILRETSRKQPGQVFDWLLPRAHRASGVTMREALKYLTPAQRKQLVARRDAGGR